MTPSGTMAYMDQQYADAEATDPAELARQHGLQPIGTRPKLGAYLRSIWSRRQFIWTLAVSNAYAQNRNTFLGQAWLVLNPLLWAAVYYTMFGLLLDTRDDAENFVAFLVIGVFMFRHMSSCVTSGAKSITGNISLVRSLHFPRAVLPISTVVTELVLLIPAVIVMFLIVGTSGLWQPDVSESVTWSWLLVFPGIVLMTMFTIGSAFIIARLVHESRDIGNLVPFVMRAAFYASGVFYSVRERFGDTLGPYAELQPFAVFLEIYRSALLNEFPVQGETWLLAGFWSVLFLVGGFIYFWRAEERYGRD